MHANRWESLNAINGENKLCVCNSAFLAVNWWHFVAKLEKFQMRRWLASKYLSRPRHVNSYWRCALKFMFSTECTTMLMNCMHATCERNKTQGKELGDTLCSQLINESCSQHFHSVFSIITFETRPKNCADWQVFLCFIFLHLMGYNGISCFIF